MSAKEKRKVPLLSDLIEHWSQDSKCSSQTPRSMSGLMLLISSLQTTTTHITGPLEWRHHLLQLIIRKKCIRDFIQTLSNQKPCYFEVNDRVRIIRKKNLFDKGYVKSLKNILWKWTDICFRLVRGNIQNRFNREIKKSIVLL